MTEPTKVIAKYTDKHSLSQPPQSTSLMKMMLLEYETQMLETMPQWAGVSWPKILTTAIECAGRNQAILRCTGMSIVQSVKTACEFGLSFSRVLGQAYLVPFKSECSLIIGYRGLLDLVRRAADVEMMDCGAVYEGEIFTVRKGTSPELIHEPIDPGVDRGAEHLTHVYSIAWHRGGRISIDYMDRAEVERIRQMSKQRTGDIWTKHFRAMALKTVIRRHIKLLPISAEKARVLERALEHDNDTAGITLNGQPQVDGESRLKALQSRLAGETPPEPPEPEIEPPGAYSPGTEPSVEEPPPAFDGGLLDDEPDANQQIKDLQDEWVREPPAQATEGMFD